MASDAVGRMKCPICSSKRARVSISKGGRAVLICNACHFQGFARSDYSDTLIRSAMTPEQKVVEAESAAPAMPVPPAGQEIAPRGAAKVVAKAAPVELAQRVEEGAQPVVAAPVKKRSKWEVF